MLKYGKREIASMVDVLDAEHATVEDAAYAALEAAERVFEARASFVVVGQLCASRARTVIPPSDPEAIKMSLGWYSTEGDARSAAESLWHNTASGDTFRAWVLNVFHGTPAAFHAERKAAYVALEEKQKEARRARIRKDMEKMRAEAEERAREAA